MRIRRDEALTCHRLPVATEMKTFSLRLCPQHISTKREVPNFFFIKEGKLESRKNALTLKETQLIIARDKQGKSDMSWAIDYQFKATLLLITNKTSRWRNKQKQLSRPLCFFFFSCAFWWGYVTSSCSPGEKAAAVRGCPPSFASSLFSSSFCNFSPCWPKPQE